MDLINQVTNLELSKRLKALGVPQISYFVWYMNSKDKMVVGDHLDLLKFGDKAEPETYSAYTSAELGEMLGVYVTKLSYDTFQGLWRTSLGDGFIAEDTEADLRGLMLEYLLEQGLLKI